MGQHHGNSEDPVGGRRVRLLGQDRWRTIHLEGAALRWTYLSVPDEKTSVARV
jgi:hypothetical protein